MENLKFNRINEVLEEKGIKKTWLAEKLGKSYRQLMAYTSNEQQPSFAVLYQIAGLLNVNYKELLRDEPVESNNLKRES